MQKATSSRDLNALNRRSKENDVSAEHDVFIGRWCLEHSKEQKFTAGMKYDYK